MSITWIKLTPGHYALTDGGWEVKRDDEQFQCYRILYRGRDQGGARNLKNALVKAGKMFATPKEAALATVWTKSEWEALMHQPFQVAA